MPNHTFQKSIRFLPTFANKHRFWHAPAVQLVPSRCDFPPESACQWHFITIGENMRNDSISKQNMALRSVDIDMAAAVSQWVDPASCWQTSAWAGEHVLLTGVQGMCHCIDFNWHLPMPSLMPTPWIGFMRGITPASVQETLPYKNCSLTPPCDRNPFTGTFYTYQIHLKPLLTTSKSFKINRFVTFPTLLFR